MFLIMYTQVQVLGEGVWASRGQGVDATCS